MKLSLVILTFNRAETVRRAVAHNLENAGRDVDELIWVDNGSTDAVRQVMAEFNPDVSVLNRENLGVAKGYNRGIVLATGTHIVITGCDRLMPRNWAKTFEQTFKQIPETGVISCYSKPLDVVPERVGGSAQDVNGVTIIPAMPMEAKCFLREVVEMAGHLREDFGLYGHEDVEWGHRVLRVCREEHLLSYTLPGFQAQHLGTEGSSNYDGKDERSYHDFKIRESQDPKKSQLLERCNERGWPYYTPYV